MSLPLTPQCEAILADIQSADASVAAFTIVSPVLPPEQRIAAALAAATPAAVADDRTPRPFAPRTNTLNALGDEAVEQPAEANGRSAVAFVLPHPATNSPADPPAALPENRPLSVDNPTSKRDQPSASDPPPSVLDSAAASDHYGIGWRPRWSERTAAGLPADAAPLTIANNGPSTAIDVPTPVAVGGAETASTDSDLDASLSSLATRSLLARWLAADATSALELERELARRGFGRLPAELVEQLLSPDVEARRSLVADLLAQPGVDARPWLVLLAGDEAAEVRLSAVSVMATSNDPQLIEEAWQVVLHDRDPRIANLAPRLRARQGSRQPH
jgi:hypothetical protein